MIIVDTSKCLGCGACAFVCSSGAITMTGGVATVYGAQCNDCGACIDVCPQGALRRVDGPIVSHTVGMPVQSTALRSPVYGAPVVPDVTSRPPRVGVVARIIAEDVVPLIWTCGLAIGGRWLRGRTTDALRNNGPLGRRRTCDGGRARRRGRGWWDRRFP